VVEVPILTPAAQHTAERDLKRRLLASRFHPASRPRKAPIAAAG
jgi:hypothetical protein